MDSAKVSIPDGYFLRVEKAFLARNAARDARCQISILNVRPTKPGVEETAIIVAFFANTPPSVDRCFPTDAKLARFKERLFLSDDPQWYVL